MTSRFVTTGQDEEHKHQSQYDAKQSSPTYCHIAMRTFSHKFEIPYLYACLTAHLAIGLCSGPKRPRVVMAPGSIGAAIDCQYL